MTTRERLTVKIACLDLERATDSLDSICQIGLACFDTSTQELSSDSWLVQPPDNRYHWYKTKRIHNISSKDTVDVPSFVDVWKILAAHLEDVDVFIGNGIRYDLKCLNHTLQKNGFPILRVEYMDSLRLFEDTFKKNHGYDRGCGLGNLSDFFDIPHNLHDAGSDAEVNLRLFLKALDEENYIPDAFFARRDITLCVSDLNPTVKNQKKKKNISNTHPEIVAAVQELKKNMDGNISISIASFESTIDEEDFLNVLNDRAKKYSSGEYKTTYQQIKDVSDKVHWLAVGFFSNALSKSELKMLYTNGMMELYNNGIIQKISLNK